MVDEVALADIRYSSRHANYEYSFHISCLYDDKLGITDRCATNGAVWSYRSAAVAQIKQIPKKTLAPKGASSSIHASEGSRLAMMGMPPLMPMVLRRPLVVMRAMMTRRRKVVRVMMMRVTVVLRMSIIPPMPPVIALRVIGII